jgi:hypothetical protein
MEHEWGRKRTLVCCQWESQKERDHWEDQDISEWIILRWILEK